MDRATFIWTIIITALALLLIASYFLVPIFSSYDENQAGAKKYLGNSREECEKIKVLCTPGYSPFKDDNGCGCEYIRNQNYNISNISEKTSCSPESREADVCIELYRPVCGWFNENIQCVKYPCAQTFSNSCFACQDNKVAYWTEGSCQDYMKGKNLSNY